MPLVMPDPVNKYTAAGVYDNTNGVAGPGFSAVNARLVIESQDSRVKSGRSNNKTYGPAYWELNIEYNDLTRSEFESIFAFTEFNKNKDIYVALPQYAVPQDASFTEQNVFLYEPASKGDTSFIIDLYGMVGTPRPGDMFNVMVHDESYTKAHEVTHVESASDYETVLTGTQKRVHFTPPLHADLPIGRGEFKSIFSSCTSTSGSWVFGSGSVEPNFYRTEKLRVMPGRFGAAVYPLMPGEVYFARTYTVASSLFLGDIENDNSNINTSFNLGINDSNSVGAIFIDDYDITTDIITTTTAHNLEEGDEFVNGPNWQCMRGNTNTTVGYHINVKEIISSTQFSIYNNRMARSANPTTDTLNMEVALAGSTSATPGDLTSLHCAVLIPRQNIYPYTKTGGLEWDTKYYVNSTGNTTIQLYHDRQLTQLVDLTDTVGCGFEFAGVITTVNSTGTGHTFTCTSHGILEGMVLVPDTTLHADCVVAPGLSASTPYYVRRATSTFTLYSDVKRLTAVNITSSNVVAGFKVMRTNQIISTAADTAANTLTTEFSNGMGAGVIVKAKLSLTGTLAGGISDNQFYYYKSGTTAIKISDTLSPNTDLDITSSNFSGFVMIPQLARTTTFTASPTIIKFHNPLVRCRISGDTQEHTINDKNLYSYKVSLMEV